MSIQFLSFCIDIFVDCIDKLLYSVYTKKEGVMEEYPKLSSEQLKRLRKALVDSEIAKSFTHASKLTSDLRRCKQQAIKLFLSCGIDGLEDISALYEVPELENDTKPAVEKNAIIEELSDSKRRRGKAKKPVKVMYPIRLESEQLEQLKALGGQVSAHIRSAIEAYLLSKQIDKKN
jgi:hypothetical protein